MLEILLDEIPGAFCHPVKCRLRLSYFAQDPGRPQKLWDHVRSWLVSKTLNLNPSQASWAAFIRAYQAYPGFPTPRGRSRFT